MTSPLERHSDIYVLFFFFFMARDDKDAITSSWTCLPSHFDGTSRNEAPFKTVIYLKGSTCYIFLKVPQETEVILTSLCCVLLSNDIRFSGPAQCFFSTREVFRPRAASWLRIELKYEKKSILASFLFERLSFLNAFH